MSWETRGNHRYYYRRRKVNGRVEAEYIGAGGVAEAMAALDERDRQERQQAADEWRTTVEAERRTAAMLAAVDDLVKSAVSAVLIAKGYHTHKRQWRKMR